MDGNDVPCTLRGYKYVAKQDFIKNPSEMLIKLHVNDTGEDGL